MNKTTFRSLALAAALTSVGLASAQSTRAIFDVAGPTLPGPMPGPIRDFQVLPNGIIAILIGYQYSTASPAAICLVNSIGITMAQVPIPGLAGNPYQPEDLEVDAAGNIYVFGVTSNGGGVPNRFSVRKYSIGLAPIWDIAFPGNGGGGVVKLNDGVVNSAGRAFVLGAVGNGGNPSVFVAGLTIPGAVNYAFNPAGIGEARQGFNPGNAAADILFTHDIGNRPSVTRLDSAGALLWNNPNLLSGGDFGPQLDASYRSTGFHTLSAATVAGAQTKVRVNRINEANGNGIWTHEFLVPAGQTAQATHLEPTFNGETMIVGRRQLAAGGPIMLWLRRVLNTGGGGIDRLITGAGDFTTVFDTAGDEYGNVYTLTQNIAGTLGLNSFSGTLGNLLSGVPNPWANLAAPGNRVGKLLVQRGTGTVHISRFVDNFGAIPYLRFSGTAQMPRASADAFTAQRNTAFSSPRTLSANDWFAVGASVTVNSQPVNGTVTVNANGNFMYTPNMGFTGTDTWTYKLQKPNLSPTIGTVTMTVNP